MNFTTAGIEREIEKIQAKVLQVRAAIESTERTIEKEIAAEIMFPLRFASLQETISNHHETIQHLNAVMFHLAALKGKFGK